ncbi:hypothetical protein D3C78_1973750 [compost metagenome]
MRASLALDTVKNRIRMCGSPAVPKASAIPSDKAFKGLLLTCAPGANSSLPDGCTRVASASRASGL